MLGSDQQKSSSLAKPAWRRCIPLSDIARTAAAFRSPLCRAAAQRVSSASLPGQRCAQCGLQEPPFVARCAAQPLSGALRITARTALRAVRATRAAFRSPMCRAAAQRGSSHHRPDSAARSAGYNGCGSFQPPTTRSREPAFRSPLCRAAAQRGSSHHRPHSAARSAGYNGCGPFQQPTTRNREPACRSPLCRAAAQRGSWR